MATLGWRGTPPHRIFPSLRAHCSLNSAAAPTMDTWRASIPSGALDYATYIGGSGFDSVNAIALDQTGNIYLTGQSGGLSQPASSGAFQPQVSATCVQFSIGPAIFAPQVNAFVLKLDPKAQSVQGLTYLGAPGCLSGSYIAVDSTGEPWIAGTLDGAAPSEPQTAVPFQIAIGPGFISKFSADFTQLLFSTYFDSISGIALDSSGYGLCCGHRCSPHAPRGRSWLTSPKSILRLRPFRSIPF